MRTHREIDMRSLELAQAIAARIDADPERAGLEKAREVCARWAGIAWTPDVERWQGILKGSWQEVRERLLDESEDGQQLRQSSPFPGILTPKERRAIWRRYSGR